MQILSSVQEHCLIRLAEAVFVELLIISFLSDNSIWDVNKTKENIKLSHKNVFRKLLQNTCIYCCRRSRGLKIGFKHLVIRIEIHSYFDNYYGTFSNKLTIINTFLILILVVLNTLY